MFSRITLSKTKGRSRKFCFLTSPHDVFYSYYSFTELLPVSYMFIQLQTTVLSLNVPGLQQLHFDSFKSHRILSRRLRNGLKSTFLALFPSSELSLNLSELFSLHSCVKSLEALDFTGFPALYTPSQLYFHSMHIR